jgi:hypothetical protein
MDQHPIHRYETNQCGRTIEEVKETGGDLQGDTAGKSIRRGSFNINRVLKEVFNLSTRNSIDNVTQPAAPLTMRVITKNAEKSKSVRHYSLSSSTGVIFKAPFFILLDKISDTVIEYIA